MSRLVSVAFKVGGHGRENGSWISVGLVLRWGALFVFFSLDVFEGYLPSQDRAVAGWKEGMERPNFLPGEG